MVQCSHQFSAACQNKPFRFMHGGFNACIIVFKRAAPAFPQLFRCQKSLAAGIVRADGMSAFAAKLTRQVLHCKGSGGNSLRFQCFLFIRCGHLRRSDMNDVVLRIHRNDLLTVPNTDSVCRRYRFILFACEKIQTAHNVGHQIKARLYAACRARRRDSSPDGHGGKNCGR